MQDAAIWISLRYFATAVKSTEGSAGPGIILFFLRGIIEFNIIIASPEFWVKLSGFSVEVIDEKVPTTYYATKSC